MKERSPRCLLKLQTLIKRATIIIACSLLMATAAAGQKHGLITGTISPPTPGVIVVAINQVTSRVTRAEVAADGRYTLKVHPGAYRVAVDLPYFAKLDKAKNYGEHALIREDSLENVIVSEGKETKIDFAVEKKEEKAAVKIPERKPLGAAGGTSVESEPQTQSDRREVRDRWRLGFPEYDRYGDKGARGRDIPFRRGRWYDPYNQSWLKGDYPIFGNKVFMIFSAVSLTTTELSRTPKPSDVSSARPGSAEFFGKPEALAVNQIFQFTFEMFHGDSTYKPRDWAIKISPTFSLPNYLNARETGVVNIDVRRGTNRTDTQFSLEESFAEVKFTDVNENFDFISARVGIQPFVSDFRGFIFSDNNLGARVFGSFGNNRYQFNAAYFAQLEKDTNSGLNRFDLRHQNVYVANIFRQDFIRKGYTIQASALYNDDRRSHKFDRNGFLVRPALIGDVRPHAIKVGYLGINGDGHVGRLNLTHSYYYAFGRDVDTARRLNAVFNVNCLRFHRTESLEYVLFQTNIRDEIGWDYSLGVAYRPLLIYNVTMTFGAATLKPGRGFRYIYTTANSDCPANLIEFCTPDKVNINPSKPLFNLFAQVKFVF